LSGSSERPASGPNILVVRAAFVPAGEQPPSEFAGDFYPLRFPATLDPAMGIITCINAGLSFGGDLQAQWVPDDDQGSAAGEDAGNQGGNAPTDRGGAGRDGKGGNAPAGQSLGNPWARAPNETRHADRQRSSIAPAPAPRATAGAPWPGYGGAALKKSLSPGISGRTADQTALDAGVDGDNGGAAVGEREGGGRRTTGPADTLARRIR
jgi:hypothetical protein